ncbi:hypothetical protein Lalb_Chr04g0257081 [Lupinus albus]|uniref:Sugar phosphate transporter domain-containing protein n=1 Tax=Lupinus albus TaxID=3870 RepID=A0A6A4QNV8_LUPAL|nr:hypothetical protein Lalb_Chr04g0257081 [Lupinus albus]
MFKALMSIVVYSISVLFKKDMFTSKGMANMVSISLGVGVTAHGETKFDAWDVTLQLLMVVAVELTHLVLIQILLKSKGISLNPITLFYYIAPCCLVLLSIPSFIMEYASLRDSSSFYIDIVTFGSNSTRAFPLNLDVFLQVRKTYALTMNVVGVVKDRLLIPF